MRNRLLIILLLFGLALPLSARMYSVIELSAGGGWSTLGYKVNPTQPDVKGANKGSWGLQAHVGYALFFTDHFGLGVGANFSHYGSTASLSGTAQWPGVIDTDGEPYTHLARIHSLQDKQDVYWVEIPLTCYFRIPLSEPLALNLEAGAKYALPLMSSASFHADIEHRGDYGIWGMDMFEVTGHGFYRERNFNNSYSLSVKNQVFVFLKLGLAYKINQKIEFFGNIYGNYGVMNTLKNGTAELGFQNDRPGMEQTHSFMPAYHGILSTNTVSAKSHPIQIGLELGFRFVFPHKKSYPCVCIDYL